MASACRGEDGPSVHQITPLFKKVATPIGGLGFISYRVGECCLTNLSWEVGALAAQSRNDDLKPWPVTSTPILRRAIKNTMFERGLAC